MQRGLPLATESLELNAEPDPFEPQEAHEER
jgi:hypothetical protein